MPVSAGISILIILAVALTTFATRVTPFLVFPKGKEIPETIQYLGKVLTPAVIGMLVVYCLKSTPVREAPHGVPELIAWPRLRHCMCGNETICSVSGLERCCICF